jgi:Uma2 family endonuclease
MPNHALTTKAGRPARNGHVAGAPLTWEVAELFPGPGSWTEEDFFRLADAQEGVPFLELSNGNLEILSMPTQTPQLILVFLLQALTTYTAKHVPGIVLPLGLWVRLKRGRIRAPDIVYMKAEHFVRCQEEYWKGADLVMEIVSPDPKDRRRDLKTKPLEYA